MIVPFSRQYYFFFTVRSFFTDFTPVTDHAVQDDEVPDIMTKYLAGQRTDPHC